MNILLIYGYSEGTLGNYWKKALSKRHNVISIGPTDSKYYHHDYLFQKKMIDIAKFIETLPKKKRPELILQIDSPHWIFLKGLEKIKVKTAFYCGDFFLKIYIYKYYCQLFDYVFVPCESFLPFVHKYSIPNAFCIPFACEPEIHKSYGLKRTIDIGFVGTTNHIQNPKRSFQLNQIRKRFKLETRSDIYGKEMAKFYSKCKIVFNPVIANGPNMRTFEATGCGALLLESSNSTSTNLYLEKNEDFIFYNSTKEAIEIISHLLKNPSLIGKLAKNGQRKTQKFHTYDLRAKELIGIIKNHPPKSSSLKSKINFQKTIESSENKSIILLIKRQLESINYRFTIPLWYIALILQKITDFLYKNENA